MSNNNFKTIVLGVIRSYSQIFFSDNYYFAIPLVIVSLFDFSAGICGLVATISANLSAKLLKFNDYTIQQGLYGFNALLVGMGLGYFYQLNFVILFIALLAGFLTLLITLVLQGILGKYYLPYLSIPFIFSFWLVLSAAYQLSNSELNTSGIYVINKIYKVGGLEFVKIHEWWTKTFTFSYINNYFTSLGALYFQPNVLSGMLVAIALIFYSRVAFVLSLIGYNVAYFTYLAIGMDLNLLGYSYIGLNFILGAIALGGYFYIPSKHSFLWAIIITPVIALVTAGTNGILKQAGLPIFSLPFNIVILSFIYSFRFRTQYSGLTEVTIQEGSPEKNLYSYQSFVSRFPNYGWFQIKLPFFGQWYVSQAHNGEYTHKGEWAFAWDFVIVDKELKQFKNNGDYVTDYYCYGQNVIAPADGTVVAVEDGIDDNIIGNINVVKNWGNTIIIKHAEGLYSKLSHLKKDSITVKVGDFVKYGKIIAKVGNSGRSPYPHLHFQLQAEPYIGAKTLRYPLFAFIENSNELKTFDYPKQDIFISSVSSDKYLASTLDLVPGTTINWKIKKNNKEYNEEWEIHNTAYNKLYIYCKSTKSILYFHNDGIYFYSSHFDGDFNSLLYKFYLSAFRLPLVILNNFDVSDNIPPNKIYKGWKLFLHDFIAPFKMLLKANYKVNLTLLGSEFDIQGYEYNTKIEALFLNKSIFNQNYQLTIYNNKTIKIVDKNSNLEAICEPF